MILVDTSIWISHLRSADAELSAALESDLVVTHPFVIGELACGNLPNRRAFLATLSNLTHAPIATDEEVLAFIEARSLMGRGIGYVDAHLLASAALSEDASLWTGTGG